MFDGLIVVSVFFFSLHMIYHLYVLFRANLQCLEAILKSAARAGAKLCLELHSTVPFLLLLSVV